ncbi:xanthine dehydrogenase [Sinorhizobium fredii USDA 205]|uniref:Molybdopterin-dependent oxidoreductase n=1 Tax=Rhizobium fredii TaxID=380 RepID=A0A844A8P1_RHIFR|nr:xanthine dehydrogenase family protein molybdopterin-binding subunit [Sinorhizobium fredii]ASY73325.1 Periplasmic aromatic aldehyde oxidoreductase, molybdenum binding subunit YagR [Sinorhizobium fredii CCBAU 83666]KSV83725.1 xanthine dehydrogenase [Sinorhizobium fredii USDA 205]MQW96596.1 molybdopterin-dependent oxidoreductase [Sinorhizobium fredii]MQX09564.1 molybdopterin-dependent oxidoreductase [Sinorhizobium fredii]UTY45467.1 xanthine dehydrogenase family protein molybdopterin-binding su
MTATSIGKPLTRVDGRAKVTGAAHYAADFNQPDQLYAVIVNATVGLGRVSGIWNDEVERMPGVVAVITHHNAPKLAYLPHKAVIDPADGERLHVLQDDEVRFYGQPVAVVVAQTLDHAERAAAALRVTYAARPPLVDPSDPRAEAIVPAAATRARALADRARGDADGAVAQAPIKIDETYEIARENHNPMEPHATIAAWKEERLTLWSKSQYLVNEQAEIAAVFGMPAENVEVVCPFIGGAFGTSLRTWPHVTLAAVAARHVGRPVKLVLTRKQMFFATGHRPRTRQRVALGATPEGRLTGIVHEGTGETSRYEQFMEALTNVTDYLYSCPNVRTQYRLTPLDTSTPNHMRGPGEASGIFALESAIDELSYKLGIDPVALRRRNEPELDEAENKPFSSRSLVQCYELGSERFGWARRTPEPRSMRDGRLLIGMGAATATYPAYQAPAHARVRLLGDGVAEVEAAASDMGPGTYTSMTQVAAEFLGLPPEQVRFNLGRSAYPQTPSHGGSWTMASVGSAIRAACIAAQAEAARRAMADDNSPLFRAPVGDLEWSEGRLRRRGQTGAGLSYGDIVARSGRPVEADGSAERGGDVAERYSMHSFGAVFAEVAIDPDVGTIRVRRIVGAYGIGRVVNPLLARSQCTGGMIGGIGMALMERTVLDPRDGRPVNAHMADYLMPVNLDIPRLEAHFVDEVDPHVNALGVKGLGEIALVGTAPAIANAVFHATGKRVRSLPIHIDDVLSA